MKILLPLLVITSFNVFAHGEKVPGPHGGHIRMPGAFHTELVLNSDSAKVYLLDARFKNPMTKNSQVGLFLNSHHESKEISCKVKEDHFDCPLPAKLTGISEISVKAVRNGAKGQEAKYPLPLSFPQAPKAAPAQDDHSHHNH